MSATNGHSDRCDSCRFWTRLQDDQPLGKCRQKPPTIILIGMQQHPVTARAVPITDTFWPITPESEVCGAWAVKPDAYTSIDLSKLKGLPEQ